MATEARKFAFAEYNTNEIDGTHINPSYKLPKLLSFKG